MESDLDTSESQAKQPLRSSLLLEHPDFAEEVLIFMDDLSAKLNVMNESFDLKDFQSIKRNAHNLTSAETFGFPTLTEVMRKLDFAAAMEMVDDVCSLLDQASEIASQIEADRPYVVALDSETRQ